MIWAIGACLTDSRQFSDDDTDCIWVNRELDTARRTDQATIEPDPSTTMWSDRPGLHASHLDVWMWHVAARRKPRSGLPSIRQRQFSGDHIETTVVRVTTGGDVP